MAHPTEFNDPQIQVEMTVHDLSQRILDLAEHLSEQDTERFALMEIRQVESALWLLQSLYSTMRQKLPMAAE